jgi:magnesium transporter
MRSPALAAEIKTLVETRDFTALRGKIVNWPSADLAEFFQDLEPNEMAVAFRLLPKAAAADVFEHLEHDTQHAMLHALGHEEVAAILNEMSDDDRTAFLEEVPEHAVRLLGMLSPDEQRVAVKLLGYPEDSVGRLMTTGFISIGEDWTVARVLDHVRDVGRELDYMNVLFVTDEKQRLTDSVRIREFLVRPLETRVSEFRDNNYIALNVTDRKDSAVEVFRKYDRTILPVVDEHGVIVGIVTVDDVLDVATEEATKDIQQMGGQESLDEPYLEVGMVTMIKKRAGWLVILFLSEMLTATAMAYYEGEIEKAAVLAVFTPLIISSGGNSGSQSSTLVIRAMALGEVHTKDWLKVLRREVTAGATLGLLLGVVGFVRITVWQQVFHTYAPKAAQPVYWHLLATTIFVSLIGVVLWGSVMGAMMPMILRRLGFDPASSSAPFVATLVDVTGLVIYFTVASQVLSGTLL